ncbi:MAG TPA: hypothetical protein VHG10_07490 [Glycomyces sp.]|nr:hypothetical protein [Glycomyces sp.]
MDTLPQFLDWCERTAAMTDLLNPLPVVKWSLDKRYLADLDAAGVPIVPSSFIAPGTDPLPVLRAFLDAHPQATEIVVKPNVGAYSRDVRRFPLPSTPKRPRTSGNCSGKGGTSSSSPT